MNEFLSEPNPWEEFLADLKVHKLYKALLKASNIALIKNIIINSWIDRRINSFEKGILKKSQSGPVNWDGEVGSFLLKTST
jgi:hypothetical protein